MSYFQATLSMPYNIVPAIDERPDDYQWERAERFGVVQSAIHNALKRLKITYKKKH